MREVPHGVSLPSLFGTLEKSTKCCSHSYQITTHLNHISHCEIASGTNWSNRWTSSVLEWRSHIVDLVRTREKALHLSHWRGRALPSLSRRASLSTLAMRGGSDEAAGRRAGGSSTMAALAVSALVNISVLAVMMGGGGGRGDGGATELVSHDSHSVTAMEGVLRRAAAAAEGDISREARHLQKNSAAAAREKVGAGAAKGWPTGKFGMALNHPIQQLSGVHSEVQFNFGGASFGEGNLVPKLRNETEEQMKDAAAPEPEPAPKPTTQAILSSVSVCLD